MKPELFSTSGPLQVVGGVRGFAYLVYMEVIELFDKP